MALDAHEVIVAEVMQHSIDFVNYLHLFLHQPLVNPKNVRTNKMYEQKKNKFKMYEILITSQQTIY